ncbi:MAG: SOS response-associated peptidase [Rhodospirillaceae bacterium]
MCGRASQYSEAADVRKQFGLAAGAEIPNTPARYNAAPRQSLLVVRHDRAAASLIATVMRWGLVPAWAKDPKIGDRAINARDVDPDGRTIDMKPMFRDAWRTGRRCIVPLNSFFEWKAAGKLKQPYAIGMSDRSLVGAAGLWETWRDTVSGEVVLSFTIITTAANDAVKPIHDRMPVIIGPDDYECWLAGDRTDAGCLLRPCPPEWLRVWPVSTRINKVGDVDDASCVEEIESLSSG